MAYQRDLEGLGRFIRERRKALGLTQAALGSRLDWSQERVSVMEHGKYGLPSLPQLCRLAEVLEVPIADLLAHTGMDLASAPAAVADAGVDQSSIRQFGQHVVSLVDQVQAVEERLHRAEQVLMRADALRLSIQRQREHMATLLAACRD